MDLPDDLLKLQRATTADRTRHSAGWADQAGFFRLLFFAAVFFAVAFFAAVFFAGAFFAAARFLGISQPRVSQITKGVSRTTKR